MPLISFARLDKDSPLKRRVKTSGKCAAEVKYSRLNNPLYLTGSPASKQLFLVGLFHRGEAGGETQWKADESK